MTESPAPSSCALRKQLAAHLLMVVQGLLSVLVQAVPFLSPFPPVSVGYGPLLATAFIMSKTSAAAVIFGLEQAAG